MIIYDKNQTLEPPEGYLSESLVADGAYLCATYRQVVFKSGTTVVRGHNVVTIYLNDMGREVARSVAKVYRPEPSFEPKVFVPAAARFRLRNGWLLISEGIREVIKCLKKS